MVYPDHLVGVRGNNITAPSAIAYRSNVLRSAHRCPMPVGRPQIATYSAPERFFVEVFLPLMAEAVRWACVHHHYRPHQDEFDDLCQEMSLLLIADDYRGLSSFDPLKAGPKTWLGTVAKNYVGRYLQQQRDAASLEALLPEEITFQPEQERERILAERWQAFQMAINKLTSREQLILQLFYRDELAMKEIAQQMKITVGSAQQLKHHTLAKLRKLITDETKGPKN